MPIVSTTVGQNPLEEMEIPHWKKKRPKFSAWIQSQK